jgi:hypothetical protein
MIFFLHLMLYLKKKMLIDFLILTIKVIYIFSPRL